MMIRRAGAEDAQAIRDLTRQAYAKWIPVIGREPFPMTADYQLAVARHWIDLLEEGKELLGLIEMIPQADHLFIENLAVSSGYQKGGAVLPEVQLATNKAFSSNLTFYQKRGFELYDSKTLPDGGTMVRFRKRVS
jgi:N-acetylglutamate synthase-like GNAT family acetyltransferase